MNKGLVGTLVLVAIIMVAMVFKGCNTPRFRVHYNVYKFSVSMDKLIKTHESVQVFHCNSGEIYDEVKDLEMSTYSNYIIDEVELLEVVEVE